MTFRPIGSQLHGNSSEQTEHTFRAQCHTNRVGKHVHPSQYARSPFVGKLDVLMRVPTRNTRGRRATNHATSNLAGGLGKVMHCWRGEGVRTSGQETRKAGVEVHVGAPGINLASLAPTHGHMTRDR